MFGHSRLQCAASSLYVSDCCVRSIWILIWLRHASRAAVWDDIYIYVCVALLCSRLSSAGLCLSLMYATCYCIYIYIYIYSPDESFVVHSTDVAEQFGLPEQRTSPQIIADEQFGLWLWLGLGSVICSDLHCSGRPEQFVFCASSSPLPCTVCYLLTYLLSSMLRSQEYRNIVSQ